MSDIQSNRKIKLQQKLNEHKRKYAFYNLPVDERLKTITKQLDKLKEGYGTVEDGRKALEELSIENSIFRLKASLNEYRSEHREDLSNEYTEVRKGYQLKNSTRNECPCDNCKYDYSTCIIPNEIKNDADIKGRPLWCKYQKPIYEEDI